ncbi:MAG: arylamine N-acetyltransferase [Thermostichus sp. HHBFW_bins_43]
MDPLTPSQVRAYLERIRYFGPTQPTLETLQHIHSAHLLAVPFENLDIHRGRPIRLERDPLYQKIVVERRGGFCFELNSLLAAALTGMGYSVQLLSGRVSRADGSFGPEFDHLALQVTLDGQAWLADVGYGDSFRQPLRLGDPDIQTQAQGRYRLLPLPDSDPETARPSRHWVVQQEQPNQTWKPLFRLDRIPRQLAEFEPMCRFHQTSPESMFTRLRLCTLATPQGRITLTARANGSDSFKWIETTPTGKQERTLKDEKEYYRLLSLAFGIHLDKQTK